MNTADFKIWEGVYASFDEAPAVGPGFDGQIWRQRSLQAARDAAAKLAAGETLDYSLRQRNAILPGVVAMLLRRQTEVSILDFGGGLGTAFIVLANTIGEDIKRVVYQVVEVDGICSAGLELFASGQGPSFRSDLPSGGVFDVVHTSSTMQYIENWQGAVARLADYGASYLVFGDLLIGDVSSYVTLQYYYDSRIRSRFINGGEFIAEVERNDYKLALRSACDGRVLGVNGPLPMENFPVNRRIERTMHLLFARSPS
jgi:putative methyltransferase (TIGR04325 family)